MRLYPLIQNVLPALPDSVPTASQEMRMLKSLPFDQLMDKLVSGLVSLSINLAIAIAVFYLGKFIIRKIYNVISRVLLSHNVDSGLRTFLLSMIRIVLYFILIVTVIGILGIETSSFLAIFASAGVAIGMALSGTLQNFAGGVLILLIKPYRVGDYIEAQGYAGTVKEIQIFHTLIVTYDNKAITIPNGGLSTGSINNWSAEKYRRIDWVIGISYGNDVEAARKEILRILDDHPLIIGADEIAIEEAQKAAEKAQADIEAEAGDTDEPRSLMSRMFKRHHRRVQQRMAQTREKRAEALAAATKPPYSKPVVVLDQLADSSVVLKVRAWAKTPDYWTAYYQVNELIYNAFVAGDKGIQFPFPQLDVHLTDSNPSANTPS